MKRVFLEGLRETIFIDENRYEIVNRGIVKSIVDDTKQIFKGFGLPQNDRYLRKNIHKSWWYEDGSGGYVHPVIVGVKQFFFIMIVSCGNRSRDLYYMAHEDTHVLQMCGKLSVLNRKLKLDLEQFDEETSASIGGLYGASKHRVDLDRIIERGHEFYDKGSFFSAVEVYVQLRRHL